ncbi:polysaccharide deacetylase [Rubrobacter xylanophilus]|uniref:Polysaccharide deacetylase n=1 Tax=Rubrobacter xylanophilus TaxID=49319 RepID=A0A510HHF3_9ACTN|nr:polysaccharide deacetylase family protein [Rubrobacter xylanophilus]BBL79328.1 polysaccharide deacetylase [Rubrobacter xylanophilus]
MTRRLPRVLMYHSISSPSEGPDDLCVSPERFEEQMLALRRAGLRGVSMRELCSASARGRARRLVGLTFDDAYRDFLEAAVPALERVGFTATVFAVAGMLGKENVWEHRSAEKRPRLALLDAAGLREAAERGMEVGSHTTTHPRLSRLEGEDLEREIGGSRRLLQEALGLPIEGLCYPYGDLSPAAVEAARRAGYRYACATKWRVEGSIHDWPRIFVSDEDTPLRLWAKLALDTLRRLTRRSRSGA